MSASMSFGQLCICRGQWTQSWLPTVARSAAVDRHALYANISLLLSEYYWIFLAFFIICHGAPGIPLPVQLNVDTLRPLINLLSPSRRNKLHIAVLCTHMSDNARKEIDSKNDLTAVNRQIIDGRRCTRAGFCCTNLPTFRELCTRRIAICSIKYSHIPTMFCTTCSLLFHSFQRRIHPDLQHARGFFLNTARLIDCNFIIKLHNEVYWLIYRIRLTVFYYCFVHICIVLCQIAFCHSVTINGLLLLNKIEEICFFWSYFY